ncbi:MAG: preprotein translocase subunit YajC [Bacteroidaceae bacterium]
MNLLTILLQQMGGGSNTSFFVMMILIFVIMYFFMIRPQNKKQKEIQNFRKNLEVGQKVVTAGGIYGQIKDVQEQTVVLEIANGVRITVDKNSIFATAPDQTAAK